MSKPQNAPVVLTFGSGPAGLKTADYRAARGEIERMGLRFASHSAFTPDFIHDEILVKSGAAKAECKGDASRSLEKFKFPQIISEGIYESVSRLEPDGARCVAVRFDPGWKGGSAGTGLGNTGIAAVPFGASLESMVPLIEERFKEVLASGAAPSIAAFKARKGTEGKLGIQIMPVQGAEFRANDGNTHIWPTIAVSYIGKVDGKALVSVGHGFDGANFIGKGLVGNLDGYVKLTDDISKHILHYDNVSQMIDLKSGNIVELCGTADFYKVKQGIAELDGMLNKQTHSAYLEIVNASLDCDDWVATQYCRFNVETSRVIGTGVVQTSGVVFLDLIGMNPYKLREMNRENKGYLLCTAGMGAGGFFSTFSPEYYSNAGAIVILYENRHAISSHLNGLPRELGIPVLCIDIEKHEFMQNLRKSVDSYAGSDLGSREQVQEFDREHIYKTKLAVYVKEFAEKGLIARI
ncbi:MAG: hypothetical protein NT051_06110 [Candidatus Micrarchaeota archaeon]|nr:hypothetical protein [Candidatus Micrarchaeota archaeon]